MVLHASQGNEHQSLKDIGVMNRDDLSFILCQDETRSGDPLAEKKALSSPFDTGLLDLSTGREVYARSSDLPGKNDLLALHCPALSMRSPIKRQGRLALVGPCRCALWRVHCKKIKGENLQNYKDNSTCNRDFTNYKITRNERQE